MKAPLIRQIAALPYRAVGSTLYAPVQMLLVTSRRTGRWIIPKGNIERGVAPHDCAAVEAVEEAGVVGTICPVPIGGYRYRKLLADGTLVPTQVEVFALAVAEELPSWKEQTQRERRWFTQASAAEAVDGPELRDLISGFTPPH